MVVVQQEDGVDGCFDGEDHLQKMVVVQEEDGETRRIVRWKSLRGIIRPKQAHSQAATASKPT